MSDIYVSAQGDFDVYITVITSDDSQSIRSTYQISDKNAQRLITELHESIAKVHTSRPRADA